MSIVQFNMSIVQFNMSIVQFNQLFSSIYQYINISIEDDVQKHIIRISTHVLYGGLFIHQSVKMMRFLKSVSDCVTQFFPKLATK